MSDGSKQCAKFDSETRQSPVVQVRLLNTKYCFCGALILDETQLNSFRAKYIIKILIYLKLIESRIENNIFEKVNVILFLSTAQISY